MRKTIWVIIIILLIGTFSDHELIKPYKDQLTKMFSQSTQDASKVHGDQSLRTIKAEFHKISIALGMGKGQNAELERLSSNVTALLEFDQVHCKEQQFNPLFFGDSLKQICDVISAQRRGLTR